MHHLQILKTPTIPPSPTITTTSPKSHFPLNPRLTNPPFPPFSAKFRSGSVYRERISVSRNCFCLSNSLVEDEKGGKGLVVKEADIVTLGNLCVDVVLNVPSLPPPSFEERLAYMERLSASKPDKVDLSMLIGPRITNAKKYWEAGGNCNMAIAAARIGLRCLTLGHVGSEVYGRFLLDVLHNEGVGMVGMSEDTDILADSASYETLLCWVLVDPSHRHGFCSRADFSDDPAFSWMSKLSGRTKTAIKQSKILFCNGYAFDELSPSLLSSALDYAIEVETSVFFDPGPRGRTLHAGTAEQRKTLNKYLRMSDVLLLTSDEAEALTDITNPILAGQEILKKGKRTKYVIVKMGSKGSILITKSSVSYAPAFKVNVIDTVGCGDSFVAAIAFGYLHNLPAVNTLTLANAVGAATAMGCGAGRNVATLEKVMEILKDSELNDDDLFNIFINENVNIPEVIRLTRTTVNGNSAPLNHISQQHVISELLPKLEVVLEKRMAPSSKRPMNVQCISKGS